MSDYIYDEYWLKIHADYYDSLKAVGWPNLSEEFNKLKYFSETKSYIQVLDSLGDGAVSLLEVGVGNGYWTDLLRRYFGKKIGMHDCADISSDALDIVKRKFNTIRTHQIDLATVDISEVTGRYSLVTAIMVLLHLVNDERFSNGMKYCARSVQAGGYLLLYEPILVDDYSPFNQIDCNNYNDNSVARSLQRYDELMHDEGLERVMLVPGASWILNSPIQATSKEAFDRINLAWRLLSRYVYRYDGVTKLMGRFLTNKDDAIKNNSPCSSYFALYKKPV